MGFNGMHPILFVLWRKDARNNKRSGGEYSKMEDLISRQAAIDALGKAIPCLTTPDGSGQFDHEIYMVQEAFVDAI